MQRLISFSLPLPEERTNIDPSSYYKPNNQGRALLIRYSHNLHLTHLANVLLISQVYLYTREIQALGRGYLHMRRRILVK